MSINREVDQEVVTWLLISFKKIKPQNLQISAQIISAYNNLLSLISASLCTWVQQLVHGWANRRYILKGNDSIYPFLTINCTILQLEVDTQNPLPHSFGISTDIQYISSMQLKYKYNGIQYIGIVCKTCAVKNRGYTLVYAINSPCPKDSNSQHIFPLNPLPLTFFSAFLSTEKKKLV